jgi:hypothetical protein
VACQIGLTLIKLHESLKANRRLKAGTYLDGTQLRCGTGRVGSVDLPSKARPSGNGGSATATGPRLWAGVACALAGA